MPRLLPLLVAAVTLTTITPVAPASAAAPTGGCPPGELNRLSAPSVVQSGLPESQLQSDFLGENGYGERGYLPVRLAGVQNGDHVEYATRWVKTDGPPTKVAHGLTGAEFSAEFAANKALYRMSDVSGFNTLAGPRFNIIWERNTANYTWLVYRDKTAAEMQDLVDLHEQDGYAPERVEGYRGQNGQLLFVSTWVFAPNCDWRMHNKMTKADYQAKDVAYDAQGFRLQQIDSTKEFADLWFHGIWWMREGPGYRARVDRDWYLHQQVTNENWCHGYEPTNLYATDYGNTVRYGGVWTFDTPITIDDSSPLADQVLEEINCGPGRGGTAIVDLHTGQSINIHADEIFGASSTIKAAILFVLLDKLETQHIDIDQPVEIPVELGGNQGPDDDPEPLAVGADETLADLARFMIDYSNNWATNRLIQYIDSITPGNPGVMDPINTALADLGMRHTRFNRYFTGDGSPSLHGSADPDENGARVDYELGYDNVTTPREFAYFLQLMHVNPGLLEPENHTLFWELLSLNGNRHGGALAAGVPDPSSVRQYIKPGSNKWGWNVNSDTGTWTSTADPGDYAHRPQLDSHVQRSEVGRIVFDDDRAVVYATFFNDAQIAGYQRFDDALDCIQVEVVRAHTRTTTGTELPQCR